MKDVSALLKQLDIKPTNLNLYKTAFTHPSANGNKTFLGEDYQRLEYIGDALLDFVSADLIFKNHPDMEEGSMSKLRSILVKSETLAGYARSLKLYEYVVVGKSFSRDRLFSSNKILEDIFESLVGAIYLDCGLNRAYDFISSFLLKGVLEGDQKQLTDAKSILQEQMQAEYRDNVHYKLLEQSGPAHDLTFKVAVMFNDIVLATGSGKSKKAAEEDAASKALEKRSV